MFENRTSKTHCLFLCIFETGSWWTDTVTLTPSKYLSCWGQEHLLEVSTSCSKISAKNFQTRREYFIQLSMFLCLWPKHIACRNVIIQRMWLNLCQTLSQSFTLKSLVILLLKTNQDLLRDLPRNVRSLTTEISRGNEVFKLNLVCFPSTSKLLFW